MPAMIAVIMVETAPPIAALCNKANTLPAATLPILACIAAAIDPNESEGSDVALSFQ